MQEHVRKGNELGRDPEWGWCATTVPSAAARSAPLHVARLAEETVVQRVAALVRGLHRQEDPAVLREQGTRGWTPGPSTAAWSLRRWDSPASTEEINSIS